MVVEAFSDFIVYADESGDHGLGRVDAGFPVFVLACCLFRKNAYINRLVPGLHGFKFRHFGHDGVILHERDMRKDEGAFAMLKSADRKELFVKELTEIVRQTPMEVVAAVIRPGQRNRTFEVIGEKLAGDPDETIGQCLSGCVAKKSSAPSGRGLHLRINPTLKRWAIINCPCGTSGAS